MIKRDLFNQVGGFSEDYFMYAEDVDLAHRLRLSGHPSGSRRTRAS